METPTQAHLYLADRRGCSQTDFLRRFHSFSFGPYEGESRKPFGALHLLNEDTLRAGYGTRLAVEGPTDVILLPVVGGLEYQTEGAGGFLEPGQAGVLSLDAGMAYTVSNPYETEFIEVIQLWLSRSPGFGAPAFRQARFDPTSRNELLPLYETTGSEPGNPGARGFIGRYDGREEGVLALSRSPVGAAPRGVYAFVLSGAFEVANRLLHEKDGLALPAIEEEKVEFEALSNDAVLILLEVPLSR